MNGTAQEHRRVLAFALLVMIFTTIPYLVGFAAQGSQWRFGGFLIGLEDGNSYLSKMREGAEGNWLYQLTYSSERYNGSFVFVQYLLGGKLAALVASISKLTLTSALLLVFHGMRFVFGMLAVVVSYRFIALILPRGHWRWLALVVIT